MVANESERCPDDRLQVLAALVATSDPQGAMLLAELMAEHPDDARLWFLHGSLLAGEQRYVEARAALGHAVTLEPDEPLARFQLGFLEMTSGEAGVALQTWAPLAARSEGDPYRLLAEGLAVMAEDRFDDALALLRRGIAVDSGNPALVSNILLIIDELQAIVDARTVADEADTGAHLLLSRYANDKTRH